MRKLPSIKRFLFRTRKDIDKIVSDRTFFIDSDVDDPRSIEEIEPLYLVEKYIVLLEDHRFFNHNGVDWISVIREMLKAITSNKHGGASTIDMQLVRTMTGYRQRTLKRKIYECLLARLLQYHCSKREILALYRDHAFFGSGLIGVFDAARANFGKYYVSLNDYEAAFVAATLVYPRPRNPTEEWHNKVHRRARYGQKLAVRYKKAF